MDYLIPFAVWVWVGVNQVLRTEVIRTEIFHFETKLFTVIFYLPLNPASSKITHYYFPNNTRCETRLKI